MRSRLLFSFVFILPESLEEENWFFSLCAAAAGAAPQIPTRAQRAANHNNQKSVKKKQFLTSFVFPDLFKDFPCFSK